MNFTQKMSFQLFNNFSTMPLLKTFAFFRLNMGKKKVFNSFNTPYYYYYLDYDFFSKIEIRKKF